MRIRKRRVAEKFLGSNTGNENSELAKELFGDAFVQHFTGTREWEWRQFSKVVTDWELKRYFEII